MVNSFWGVIKHGNKSQFSSMIFPMKYRFSSGSWVCSISGIYTYIHVWMPKLHSIFLGVAIIDSNTTEKNISTGIIGACLKKGNNAKFDGWPSSLIFKLLVSGYPLWLDKPNLIWAWESNMESQDSKNTGRYGFAWKWGNPIQYHPMVSNYLSAQNVSFLDIPHF